MTFNLSESDSFKEMYDTFARHCNENPVSAVADLKANKEAVEHHIKELKSGIEEQYQEITSLLSSGLITENFQAERDRILTQIRESISNED